ncbi:unnamed protein product [Bursaphelenchus xylophilus]|uniref:(pine wood nematode) hypothetical protein n=1 Tax=Bursaphelenchus xylophilus TaxID=6326 RepID=A0A1I7RRB0_BURXY|nr:unnamed protein product [Bursaphelenchus xylophilus]CAG9130908.1 unnamed protein product [Bursaphelenchus xylophilus]
MFAHLQSNHKRISFVKANEEELKSIEDKNESNLDGTEVRAFYESVIQETSSNRPPEQALICKSSNQTSIHRRTHVTKKPTDKEKLNFSDRDIRLFLKAVNDNEIQKVSEYLAKGIDPNSKDCHNWSALMIAAAEGHAEMVEMLLENGANAGHKCGKFDSISLARTKRKPEIADMIDSYRNPKEQDPGPSSSNEKYYCELCEITYSEDAHETSIVHIVNMKRRPNKGFAYDIPMSNFGYGLLKKKGWTEESGLGKEGEGRQYPIRTILKRDRKGLGVEKLPSKVTHFKSLDPAAVKLVEKKPRGSHIKEMHRQIDRRKKREESIRRMLNSD